MIGSYKSVRPYCEPGAHLEKGCAETVPCPRRPARVLRRRGSGGEIDLAGQTGLIGGTELAWAGGPMRPGRFED